MFPVTLEELRDNISIWLEIMLLGSIANMCEELIRFLTLEIFITLYNILRILNPR